MARIDHVFVFSRAGAPERARLQAAGLAVGRERAHPGQGTANACVCFGDAYLELLWLADEAGARAPMVKPLGLQERAKWREYRASPFGICLRADRVDERAPFAHWDYRPAYLPAGETIDMGCNSGVIGEPLLFFLRRPYEPPPVEHALARAALREVRVTTPALAPMSPLRDLRLDGVTFADGAEHLMELTFGDGDTELDLRPDLPLILRW